ncbi:carbohydrate sulfotransferase 11-like [Mya arenaria]|uniref:carbohydrate sulfotransferase 11-like n=1 Tax=Mya arenaria TaxID=6604 RepID=UPI0022E136C3|nr:carbohydrate sulfotransferase 11-like [Mya arenaria]
MKHLDHTGSLWTEPQYNIHWCVTPKIGSTHWKQVLRFLSGDYPAKLNITKPEDISRLYVHSTTVKNIKRRALYKAIVRGETSSGKLFMFAREPFSRLWSAYIDKFFLPDFWEKEAPAVVSRVRSNVTSQQITCTIDVTFVEFLLYIVQSNTGTLNPHWRPVSKLCNPCHVEYDVIGKQETFANDSNLIINKFGLRKKIPKSTSTKSSRANEEITMLVKFNFDLEHSLPEGCFDAEDVAKRLWKAFQYNGYIHRSIEMPLSSMLSHNFIEHPTAVFLKHAYIALQYQSDNKLVLKDQKLEMMLEAYAGVSRNLVDKIKEVYSNDFEMFGYDKYLL